LSFLGIPSIARIGLIGFLTLAGGGAVMAQDNAQDKSLDNAPPLCVSALSDRFDLWLQEPALQGAAIGVALETVEGKVLYHYQAHQRFIPASTQKLLTTAAALEQWGSDRTWKMTVSLSRRPNATELWVTGQGDPTITEDSLRALAQEVTRQLQHREINHIDRLVGDDRFLGEAGTPPTWEIADTRAGYGAPTNALVLTENAIPFTLWPQAVGQPLRLEWETPEDAPDWEVENFSVSGGSDAAEFVSVANLGPGRSGRSILRVEGVLQAGAAPEPVSVAVSDPGKRFLQRFQTALETAGVTVTASQHLTFPDNQPSPGETIVTHTSPPLSELITITNQQSQNLYAEILLRWLGQANPQPTPPGLAPSLHEQGIQHLTQILLDWGLDPQDFTIADGSGLSRHNSITPAALVQLLQHSAQSPWAAPYRNSLSRAGQSGTLARRFAQTPLEGKLWGKSGSMDGTLALAGYLTPDRYSPLTFSILINQSVASYSQLFATIDRLLETWITLQNCAP